MDIIGIPKANNGRIRYEQENNSTESLIKKALYELRDELKKQPLHLWPAILVDWTEFAWLESCSTEAIATILEGFGVIKEQPEFLGLDISAGDFLTNHLNLPANDKIYSKGLTFDNRNIYNLQKMVEKIGMKTLLLRDPKFIQVREHYKKGRGALLMKKPGNAGHYVAGIGYDKTTRTNVHHDPYGKSIYNKHGGKFETLTISEWQEANILYALIIWK
jgi:hypothetical protein